MAKHGKASPAPRPQEEDDSILLRSAETIGRVIGTLQRQLDGARGRFSEFVLDKMGSNSGNGSRSKQQATRKNGATKARQARSTAKSASRAARSTVARKTVVRKTVVRKTVARKTVARKGTKR